MPCRSAGRNLNGNFQLRCHVHELIGLPDLNSIYLAHTHELGQCTENGLYRNLSLTFHVPSPGTVDPYVIAFIFITVIGDRALLLVNLAQNYRHHLNLTRKIKNITYIAPN